LTHWTLTFCASTLMVLATGSSQAETTTPVTRGQLLYNTHCMACHDTQLHWRANKLADNWTALRKQVRRWQGVAKLDWSDEDITLVARYLNDTIYDYPVDKLAQRN
jgi:mono/diheme cytochrome c family protein